MASALQVFGAKSTFSLASRRSLHCQPLLSQRIGFAASVASVSGLCRLTTRVSSEKVAFSVSCKAVKSDLLVKDETENQNFGQTEKQFTCVMKFGGSSVATAERMREVASLILSFPEESPIIVLSAMGKTTNKLLLVLFCLILRQYSFSFLLVEIR